MTKSKYRAPLVTPQVEIVGLDFGLRTGLACWGVGRIMSVNELDFRGLSAGERLHEFHQVIMKLRSVGVEQIYYEDVMRFASSAAARVWCGFLAILELTGGGVGCPVGTVKKYATGNGRASKEEMVDWAAKTLASDIIKEKPTDNEADALAVLYCGMEKIGWPD